MPSDTCTAIVAALRDTLSHIRTVTVLADDDTRPAIDQYVVAVLDAQLTLRRELGAGK